MSEQWEFHLAVDEAGRLPILNAGMGFPSIAKQIRTQMRVLCAHCSEMGKPACSKDHQTNFRRPVFTVEIERWLFDVFFNSPLGYRAAYFRGVGFGQDMNAFFMRVVASRLVEAPSALDTVLSKDFIWESLLSPSSKVWLAEAGNQPDRKCKTCEGDWTAAQHGDATAEIINNRWEKKGGYKANWGRKAPYLTKLRIMGAFLNSGHDEIVSSDKRFRGREIHRLGWS